MQIYGVVILFDHMVRKLCAQIFIPAVCVCVCVRACVCARAHVLYVCCVSVYVCKCMYEYTHTRTNTVKPRYSAIVCSPHFVTIYRGWRHVEIVC
jgi:hypothetical protein